MFLTYQTLRELADSGHEKAKRIMRIYDGGTAQGIGRMWWSKEPIAYTCADGTIRMAGGHCDPRNQR